MSTITKNAIKTAFGKLIREKPINRITVKDISESCGINRNTFYYHYQDIPTLIEEIITEDAKKLIDDYSAFGSLEDCILAIVDHALENRSAVLHIYDSPHRDIYEHYLWDICEHVVTAYADTALADTVTEETDKKALVGYYKALTFGVVMDWLGTGMKSDMAEKVHRYLTVRERLIGKGIILHI